MATFTANRRNSKNSDEIIDQDYECTKCLKCLKPATSVGCGYVLLDNIRVTAAWCDDHGGTGPGLLNQRDQPVGALKKSIDQSSNCWGGWHKKYGIRTQLISRG